MSVTSKVIWRGVQQVLRAVGLVRAKDAGVAPLKLTATIEIFVAPEPPEGGTPAALPLPVLGQTAAVATMYRAAPVSPLSSQLAFTARRNVPKGRKPASLKKPITSSKPVRAAALPRKATAIKAKPVVVVIAKKKSLKRRHVWLSTQSRVIHPVAHNVVQLASAQRTQRIAARPTTQKTASRQFKLAA